MKLRTATFFLLISILCAHAQTYTGGYYFLDKFKLTGSLPQQYQLILDDSGSVVYIRPIKSLDFTLQPNGLMSYHFGNKFWLMDSTFTVVDSVSCKNGVLTDDHDFQILPNGHFLLLGRETITMDLSSYLYFGASGNLPGSATASVACSVIQEQDENKNVVFEWHTKDFFSFDDVDTFFLSSPSVVDWTHSNSVAMDNDGNILLSSRGFDELTKINRTDSSIMWRFGGKHNQFTYLGNAVPFYGQHDARRIANGHLTVFDNGYHAPTHGSRALEYALDETNKTAELKWSYVYDSAMYARGMGNVQRLGNSNTVISYGDISSNRNVCFTKVDSSGNILFEYSFVDSSMTYRAFYYPQLPFQLHRPVITCYESGGVYYLDAGAGYASYLWSDGSNAQTLAVTDTGVYYVTVPYGDGGLITSGNFFVSNASNPCASVASVEENIQDDAFTIYPNPTSGQFTIHSTTQQLNNSTITISNLLGEKVYSNTFINRASCIVNCALKPGLYFVKVITGEKTCTRKLIVR